ncbi:MAG: DUF4358 domain-containing protein [Lachnospiraceae bacterium]|nr:DUF4358 domain-containing protein [Lachnospiraceae bacterium]
MRKRGLSVIALGLSTVMLISAISFTGCNNSDNKESNSTTKVTENTNEDTETTAEETTAEETTAEETTIEETTEPKESLKISDICDKLFAAGYFSDTYSLDEEDLMDYYGVDVNDATEYAFYQGTVSPSADVLALFRAKDNAAASRIETALNTVLDSIKDSTKDYAPEEYDKTTKAEVVNDNNFVYLVICNKTEEAKNDIETYK